MPLQIQPWEDADFDVYPELAWSAFKDDLMAVMYPNGFLEQDRKETARSSRAKHARRGDVSVWMKTIDTDLPLDDPMRRIAGVAHWHFYPEERSDAELTAEENEEDPDKEPSPGMNKAFTDQFFSDIEKFRRQNMGGKPYVLLHMLAVRPEYHRRGIGGMHLAWGNEQADKLGLPLYLESSPIGRPLYERYGYEAVASLPCDAKAHGHPKDLPHTCMLRPAKGR